MKTPNENRASQIESLLQQLPEAAEKGLSGLTAGPDMRARILLAAAKPEKTTPRLCVKSLRWISAACCAAVLALVISFALPKLPGQQNDLMISSTLGGNPTSEPVISADLHSSGMVISSGNSNPDYRSMWAPSAGGSFPLIGVNGKYYRMMTWPRNVSSSLQGSALGSVAEFTTEPSLAGTDTILSNAAAFGETVYAVRGMGDTLVIANVDGQMRLFQRVSFNGNALRGRETLEDTLQVRGKIIGMELTGVGTITDSAVCTRLADVLFSCASYESSGSISSRQSLILELDNGLVVQLAVKSDSLAACGVWSCPEFFEAFEDACD